MALDIHAHEQIAQKPEALDENRLTSRIFPDDHQVLEDLLTGSERDIAVREAIDGLGLGRAQFKEGLVFERSEVVDGVLQQHNDRPLL